LLVGLRLFVSDHLETNTSNFHSYNITPPSCLLSKDHTARFYVDPHFSQNNSSKYLLYIYGTHLITKKITIAYIKANMAGFYYAGDFAQFHNIGNFAEYIYPSNNGFDESS